MEWDAVLLAGGRASRMGGIDKTALLLGGESLLDIAVRAAAGATHLSLVGLRRGRVAPSRALLVQEEPRFSGPASAIAAGLDAIGSRGVPAAMTLVLACDVPRVEEAVRALLDAVARILAGQVVFDGLIAVDDDKRRQPLLALYRTDALHAALESHRREGTLVNLSLRAVLQPLELVDIPLSTAITADIDTPGDAISAGIDPSDPQSAAPPPTASPNG